MATQVFGSCFFLLIQDFPLHLYLIVSFPFKARAGVEMVNPNSIRIPVWKLFGGPSDTMTTDITVFGHPIILCLYQQNL